MHTETTVQQLPNGTKYITEPKPEADYVSVAEYIRRRHAADLEKDAQADPLWANSINSVIKRGFIVVLIQGSNKFIDWNEYKSYVFKRYRQIPQTKGKTG